MSYDVNTNIVMERNERTFTLRRGRESSAVASAFSSPGVAPFGKKKLMVMIRMIQKRSVLRFSRWD